MSIYIPFTYIIGWSEHKKFYYGAKYAKGCCPLDLWKTYFTSSKYVEKFREKFGEPDIIKIHRTFNHKKDCLFFEQKYLTKIDAKNNPTFLNKSNGNHKFTSKTSNTNTDKKWYNDGEKNYKLNEKEKQFIKHPLFSGMVKRVIESEIKNWYNDGIKNYKLTDKDFKLNLSNLNKGKIYTKTKNPESQNDNYSNFTKNKNLIPCYDKYGNYIRISREQYYSQTGAIEDREWVFNTSKEGLRRSGKPPTKSTKNLIPCVDKNGKPIRIKKEQYYSQTGPINDREYVTIRSFEGKKRLNL